MINNVKNMDKEKDNPQYLNYLFLRAFLEVCKEAETPEDVLRTIEAVIDGHAYDIPLRLRREAMAAGRDFADRILDDLAANIGGESDDDDGDEFGWKDGLISDEEAGRRKEVWEKALLEGKKIRMTYVSDTSGHTERIVKPTGIKGPYGEGFCLLRKDGRVFRFDRMLEAHIE